VNTQGQEYQFEKWKWTSQLFSTAKNKQMKGTGMKNYGLLPML